MPQTYSYEHYNVTFPQDGIAVVEINRAEALNAFTESMIVNIGKIFNQLSTDSDCRAIVLTGAGDKAFTAGLDIKKANLAGSGKTVDPARKMISELRPMLMSLQNAVTQAERCLKPVISVLHGYSFGMAIDLSTATDIRICTEDVKLSVKEVDIGLAADVGSLSRLVKVVGSMSWVKDICYTARIFGAEEALKQGLVTAVYKDKKEALEGALKLAELIASKSPVAVQSSKELLNYSVDHSVEDGLRYTAAWNPGALQTIDIPAAIKGSLTRSKPRFEKL
ncbi:hypothetical protein H072_4542 [Dactylellina haptotyla CBS 200.50]|uniref:Enoyl-CoA hydratase n=1 Tax=Dactylellina haptotyla (strain CBS 200.50) TaxID=1284197 RepID=S8C1P1_DACHA|nr:hypothetical protein H072_4542 [Dactylellina haptotyla CBS 200.50]